MKIALKILLFTVGAALLMIAASLTGAFFTSVLMASGFDINPVNATLVIAAIALFTVILPKRKGVLNDITVELWVKYIMDNLFKTNEFLDNCFIEDEHVLAGSVVHIPQAGAKATVVKNRNVLPANVTRRSDTDITYVLDEYTTDPILITAAEAMEVSYAKIDSVLSEHIETIREVLGDDMLYRWRPEGASNFIKTTGTDVAAHLAGAAGNRKKFVKENLKAARFRMNKDNLPKNDRFALLSSDFLEQLHDDADLKSRDMARELDMKNGTIDMLYGFKIMERSNVLIADNSGTPVIKAVDAIAATTDNDVALCWQKNTVARAMGTIDFFEDLKNPLYYGDIYSALVKAGGRKRRGDNKGIVGIVQASS